MSWSHLTQFHPSRPPGENVISFNLHNQPRDGIDGIHFVFPQDAHLGHAQPTAHPKATGDTLRSQWDWKDLRCWNVRLLSCFIIQWSLLLSIWGEFSQQNTRVKIGIGDFHQCQRSELEEHYHICRFIIYNFCTGCTLEDDMINMRCLTLHMDLFLPFSCLWISLHVGDQGVAPLWNVWCCDAVCLYIL